MIDTAISAAAFTGGFVGFALAYAYVASGQWLRLWRRK